MVLPFGRRLGNVHTVNHAWKRILGFAPPRHGNQSVGSQEYKPWQQLPVPTFKG